jgi:hypothetical protein
MAGETPRGEKEQENAFSQILCIFAQIYQANYGVYHKKGKLQRCP